MKWTQSDTFCNSLILHLTNLKSQKFYVQIEYNAIPHVCVQAQ